MRTTLAYCPRHSASTVRSSKERPHPYYRPRRLKRLDDCHGRASNDPTYTDKGGLAFSSSVRVDLAEQPNHLPPLVRMHRQHVDDVRPVVASLVALAEQLRGDRVAVGLLVDQDSAEVVAGLRVE